MVPARPRPDDSRSETSSSITNLKDRTAAPTNGHIKNRKTTQVGLSSLSKTTMNGTTVATIPPETDPNLPRTNWLTIPTPTLQAYAFTHNLPTPSPHTHPHAALLYNSTRTGLRAPSVVAARRRLHDLKAKSRRKSSVSGVSILRGKELAKERERSSDRLKLNASTAEALPVAVTATTVATQNLSHGQRIPPNTLAMAVRRHFNSAQVNESDAIARFLYVVRHGGQGEDVKLIGGVGDGWGRAIGMNGRSGNRGLGVDVGGDEWVEGAGGEIGKRWAEAGGGGGCDIGFRLRFRPGM